MTITNVLQTPVVLPQVALTLQSPATTTMHALLIRVPLPLVAVIPPLNAPPALAILAPATKLQGVKTLL